MTKDLEETLAELGPGYRAVANRVLAAYAQPRTVRGMRPVRPVSTVSSTQRRGSLVGWSVGYLVAASLLIFLGLGFWLATSPSPVRSDAHLVYTVAYAPNETALAAILASQRADGSWDNDFITRQNAAALRDADSVETRIAYKRALRYLKSRGLRPLSALELKLRSDEAAHLQAES